MRLERIQLLKECGFIYGYLISYDNYLKRKLGIFWNLFFIKELSLFKKYSFVEKNQFFDQKDFNQEEF